MCINRCWEYFIPGIREGRLGFRIEYHQTN